MICMNLADLEKTLGTVVFLCDFFFKSFMIQVILYLYLFKDHILNFIIVSIEQ